MRKLLAVALCLTLAAPVHASDKFYGWMCIIVGGLAVADGYQTVRVKTGTETKRWAVISGEYHYIYASNKTTLIDAWYFQYPYEAQDGVFVESVDMTSTYFDSFNYYHKDNYTGSLYEKKFDKTTEQMKSVGEVIAGGALIGTGLYLLAKKPMQKLADSLKGNGISLAYNNRIDNPTVTASIKF